MTLDRLSEIVEVSPGLGPDSRRRAYDSPRRREQARATRAAIAHAARRRFLAHGWAGTRVRDVAADAGVAEATVYAVYGSKAGLAHALVDSVDLTAEVAASAADITTRDDEPATQLAALVAADRRLFEHGGDVIALLRDGGRTEDGLRAAYQQGRRRANHIRRAVFTTWPADALRPGVDVDHAADTFAAICNIDVYGVLVDERGWTPGQVEAWWRQSLQRLLLADSPAPRCGPPTRDGQGSA